MNQTNVFGQFTDWAGQRIRYRVRVTKADENTQPGDWLTCEINPHGDAWHVMARGKSTTGVVKQAVSAWNKYDREPAPF